MKIKIAGYVSGLISSSMVWAPAIADEGGPYYGPHMWGSNGHGWFFGPLMMVLFIALIVAAIVWAVRAGTARSDVSTTPSAPPGQPSALEILQKRFARGELDETEYKQRRKVLEDG